LKAKLKKIDDSLKNNPKDPAGLLERGELRLEQGDLTGAVQDLRQALANNPPADLLPRTRNRLYEAMTEGLRLEFAANEKYLDEYKKLCETAFDPNLKEEEKGKERELRLSTTSACSPRAARKQGRLVEAFSTPTGNSAPVPQEKR